MRYVPLVLFATLAVSATLHAQRKSADGAKRAAPHNNAASKSAKSSILLGNWRIAQGVVAPWLREGGATPNANGLVGRTVRFDVDRATGPGAFTCTHATYESAALPAAGLFQGMLPTPATQAAVLFGMVNFPVPGARMNCDTGSYDFHLVDDQTLLIGLDNVVWTLTRAKGAMAAAATPSGVVEAFLERHFAGDMGFLPTTVAQQSDFLADSLLASIAQYFAKPSNPNEVPWIDGDPFTDSQEYPTRFAVGDAQLEGRYAHVTVRFADGYTNRSVVYLLQQQRGQWRIADTRNEHRVTLSGSLRK